MKNTRRFVAWILSLSILVLFSFVATAGPLTFTPSNIYTTQFFSSDVIQYTAAGNLVTTTSITGLRAGEETKGLGFGPDGNLDVVSIACFRAPDSHLLIRMAAS